MTNSVSTPKSPYRTRRPLKYVMYEQICRIAPLPNGSGSVIECKETGAFYIYGMCRKEKWHRLCFLHDDTYGSERVPEGDKYLGYGFVKVVAEQYHRNLAQSIAEAPNKPEPVEFSVTDMGRSFRFTLKQRPSRRKFRGIPVIWDFTIPE